MRDDEGPAEELKAGGSSSFVDTTTNPGTISTKPNPQGTTTLSMDTTTKLNSEESHFANDIGNYVDRPLTDQQNYYILCNVWAFLFRSYMEKKSTPIEAMLDEVKKQQIEENRKQL